MAGALCGLGNGTCMHLKDCVLDDFLHEFEVYLEEYFCEISGCVGQKFLIVRKFLVTFTMESNRLIFQFNRPSVCWCVLPRNAENHTGNNICSSTGIS